MDSNKRYIKKPSRKSRPNYTGRRIGALLAAGLIVLSAGSAIRKGKDMIEASSAQNELKQYELSLDNNVPGRAELGAIIIEFNEQNPEIESDFMSYLDAQKDLFNKEELSASKEKVNSYKESIEQLNSDISDVISKYQSSDKSDSNISNLDNPMAIIEKYNSILKDLDNYDNNMPVGKDALRLELHNQLKSIKNKEGILQDIKNRYVKEYNANKNTKLNSSNIKLSIRPQNYIIQTESGKYITHGDYPDRIASFLGNQPTKTISNIDVYSIYNNDKLIESVAKVDSKTCSIYDGNNPTSLYENNDNKTLKEFIYVIDSGLTWYNSPDDSYAKENYIESIVNLYSKKELEQSKNLEDIDSERI